MVYVKILRLEDLGDVVNGEAFVSLFKVSGEILIRQRWAGDR